MEKKGVLDDKVVTELKSLMGDDCVTLYKTFLSSSEQNIRELNQAVKDGDIKNIETLSHALKGSSANIGAIRLSGACMEILEDARKSVTENFDKHLDSINLEYARASDAINNLFG